MPDLVLSGVNKGRNVAEDVVYSGTIAGALEGTILGLPSFALSQEFSMETARHAVVGNRAEIRARDPAQGDRCRRAQEHRDQCQLSRPARPSEVKGMRVTRQGKRNLGFLKVDQRRDGRGNPYFWIGFERAGA